MSNIQPAKNAPRDYLEIGAAFLIIVAILLVLGQLDLLPNQFGVSETMSYGLDFVIRLVASVSSCIAVTGGPLVGVGGKEHDGRTTLTTQELKKSENPFDGSRIPGETRVGRANGARASS